MRQVLIGHLCQRDLSDIQLLALDQLQQQIERAFEGWELESVVYSFGKHRLAAMLLWLQQRYFPCFSLPLWFRPKGAKPKWARKVKLMYFVFPRRGVGKRST